MYLAKPPELAVVGDELFPSNSDRSHPSHGMTPSRKLFIPPRLLAVDFVLMPYLAARLLRWGSCAICRSPLAGHG